MDRGRFIWTSARRRGAAVFALLAVLLAGLYLPVLLQVDTRANVREDEPLPLPDETEEPPLLGPPAPPPQPAPPGPLLIGVLGDTGVTTAATNNVAALTAAGTEAFLGLGDYAYWEPVDAWASLMAPLLALPHHLVLGNHDEPDAYAPYAGANGSQFSVLLNGARFIGLDTDRRTSPWAPRTTSGSSGSCHARSP